MTALESLSKLLADPTARPLFLTGAGISAASGIPTFRGTEPGAVWAENVLEKGTLRFFHRRPVDSWQFYLDRFDSARGARPNAAHHALVALQQRNPELVVVTQNVDGLHAAAGTQNLVEIHGSAHKVRCTRRTCVNGAPAGFLPWSDALVGAFRARPSHDTLPRCPVCQGLLRPHVLWFDETYDSHVDYGLNRALTALSLCSVLVFVGTSHAVGVTEAAVDIAARDEVPMFDIDPNPSAKLRGLVRSIPLPAEVALPQLV